MPSRYSCSGASPPTGLLARSKDSVIAASSLAFLSTAFEHSRKMVAFGKKGESYVQAKIVEARFTVGMVKLHKVAVEVSANGQRFQSRFEKLGPVDPVSHRYKCQHKGATLQVPLIPWDGPPTVNVALWDRSRRRRTCLGNVEIPVQDILEDLAGTGTTVSTQTFGLTSTLFPALNSKVDVEFEISVNLDDLEHWKTMFPPTLGLGSALPSSDTESLSSMLYSTDLGTSDSEAPKAGSRTSLQPLTALTPPPASVNLGRTSSHLSAKSSTKSSKLPRRHRKGGANFKMDVDSNVQGIIYLEVVSARNLPRFRTLTGLSFDMDPFVVISFAKRNFKTPYRRHTTNPTFNQKLMLMVDKSELNYDIEFTVWDKDRVTLNDRVGSGCINVREICEYAPPLKDGIYNFEKYTPHSTVIPLEIFDAAHTKAHRSKQGKDHAAPQLMVNVHYLPFPAVRQEMWRGLISMYDGEEADQLQPPALEALLKSIGSNVTGELIKEWFGDQKALSTDQIVARLERQLKLDNTKSNARIISFRVCPVCQKPRLGKYSDQESLKHISFCASRQWSGTDAVLLDDRYVTSAQASRRWYSKFLSRFSFGSYQIGANNANILVQDRISGQIREEKMSSYVRLGIRVIYAAGPLETKKMQKMLKKYTLKQGIKFDSPSSASSIAPFIKFHSLDMADVKLPTSSFKTFNEFFYRELKEGSRPCESADDPRTAVSLADCRLTAFPTIDEATNIWIKGKNFSVKSLLGDAYPEDAKLYEGGSLAIFRLAPQDYHRFHIPVEGKLGEAIHIPGEYYTVNPMAIRSALDVYGLNARTVVPIDSPQFGRVMVVLIGAMMVGSIVVTAEPGSEVKRTDELGYFKFGGSTCVVLFEPLKITFDTDLVNNSSSAIETLVRVGMSIGHTPSVPEYTRVYDTRRTAVRRAVTTIEGGGSYMPFSLD